MQCIEEKQDVVAIVGLNGRMDAKTAPLVQEKLLGLIDQGEKRLVVDCTDLAYVSSAGLRIFLMAAKRLTQNSGRLVMAAMNEDVKQVFDLTGFSTIFTICTSREDAIGRQTRGA